MRTKKRMMRNTLLCIPGLLLLLFMACQVPVLSNLTTAGSSAASSPTTTAATPQSPQGVAPSIGGFSLAVDSSANQGLLVTPDGNRIPIEATGSDGSLVKCVTPISVATLKGDSSGGTDEKSEIVIGTTDKGSAGIWVYTSAKKFKSVEYDGKDHKSNELPESDDHKGDFKSAFGWTYHVVDMSADGRVIVGYAENEHGFNRGHYTVDPGTKVGVYWSVRSSRGDRHHHVRVSTARIIGTLDPSAFHSRGRGHEHRRKLRSHHALEHLRLFMLDYYSAYLTLVEKKLENGTKAITYDASNKVYKISGVDQDDQDAIASLGLDGKITIDSAPPPPPPPPTTSVDLSPGALTVSQYQLFDTGQTVSGSLVLNNVGVGTFTGSIPVDFYVSPSSTFQPGSATVNYATSYSETIAAGAQVTVSYSFTMPTLGTAADQAVYVYADVDPTNTLGDIDMANNFSTPANAGVIFVSSGSGSYSLELDTYYPPTGVTGQTSGTGATNMMIALYKDNGSGATYVGSDVILNSDYFGRFTVSNLTPGTYYVVVLTASPGPYALVARTPNIALNTFGSLSAPPMTTNQNNDIGLYSTMLSQSALSSIPAPPYAIKIGNAVNWYGSTQGDCQWFTFNLQ